MEVTPLPMVTDDMALQKPKALTPMEVRLEDITTEVRAAHCSKALNWMEVTFSGTRNAPALPPGHWINVVLALLYSTPSPAWLA